MRLPWFLPLLVLAALPLSAAEAAPNPAALVRLLADEDPDIRAAAQRKLVESGEAALPALEAAQKSDDLEVRTRAARAARTIKQAALLRSYAKAAQVDLASLESELIDLPLGWQAYRRKLEAGLASISHDKLPERFEVVLLMPDGEEALVCRDFKLRRFFADGREPQEFRESPNEFLSVLLNEFRVAGVRVHNLDNFESTRRGLALLIQHQVRLEEELSSGTQEVLAAGWSPTGNLYQGNETIFADELFSLNVDKEGVLCFAKIKRGC